MHQFTRPSIGYFNRTLIENTRKASVQYLAALMLPALLCGWSAAMAAAPQKTELDQHSGAEIFKHTCSVCHGEQGGGAMWGKLQPPARNFTTSESAAKLTRDRMIYSVTYGRTGTAMQPFGNQLSSADIETVVDYILETYIAKAGISDMSLPMPLDLKGDRIRGCSLYQANCSPCHGQSGDGRGPRAYFINPKPRNFLLDTSRRWLNRPTLFQIITDGSIGTEMPSWSKVLNNQEIADIAEFMFRRYTNPEQLAKGTENSNK